MQTLNYTVSKAAMAQIFDGSSLLRPNGSELLTADQLAKHLGVKVGWVKRQSRAGTIPSIKLGKCYRYRKADVDLWLSGMVTKRG